ncbi:MAG: hypothetical protein ACFB2Z_01345 [Maricaulaceae bacterium]
MADALILTRPAQTDLRRWAPDAVAGLGLLIFVGVWTVFGRAALAGPDGIIDDVLGVDAREYFFAVANGEWFVESAKRPLFGPIAQVLRRCFDWAPGVDAVAAAQSVFALFGLIAIAACYGFARLCGCAPVAASVISVWAFSSFALSFAASVYDSYMASVAALFLVGAAALALARWGGGLVQARPWLCVAVAGLASLGAGWLYAPWILASALFAAAFLTLGPKDWRRWIRALAVGAIPLMLYPLPFLAHPEGLGAAQGDIIDRYASLRHLVDPAAWAQTTNAFFLSLWAYPGGIIPGDFFPNPQAPHGWMVQTIADTAAAPLNWGLAGTSLAAVGAAVGLGLRRGGRAWFVLALLGLIGAQAVFYVYFAPGEALLFASPVMAGYAMLLALGRAQISGPAGWRCDAGLAALAMICVVVNAGALDRTGAFHRADLPQTLSPLR